MPLHHSPARLTPPRHSPRSTPPRRSAYTALANSELLQLAALSPSSHVPSPSRQRRRPRGRDAPFAQRSPRGLWRYLSALGGDKADLSAQEIEYAEEFTRRAQGASSRFALFPAAAQGAGVALSEAVAQHGRLRAVWASLTQAGRFKVLRIPRPLLLERARALLGRAGDSAECWAPPGGVATLAAFLNEPGFADIVQRVLLDALVFGRVQLPVHQLARYGRPIPTERGGRSGRGRGRGGRDRGRGRGRASRGGRRGAQSKNTALSRDSAYFRDLSGHYSRPGTPKGRSTPAVAARSRPRAPPPRGRAKSAASSLDATAGFGQPGALSAEDVLSACREYAVPMEPADAVRRSKVPWKTPFAVVDRAGDVSCYCLRCSCYRSTDEFFLWNLAAGMHCSDESCPVCFRRGVRWCWWCCTEEMATESVSGSLHDEAASVALAARCVGWIFRVVEERLLAATVGGDVVSGSGPQALAELRQAGFRLCQEPTLLGQLGGGAALEAKYAFADSGVATQLLAETMTDDPVHSVLADHETQLLLHFLDEIESQRPGDYASKQHQLKLLRRLQKKFAESEDVPGHEALFLSQRIMMARQLLVTNYDDDRPMGTAGSTSIRAGGVLPRLRRDVDVLQDPLRGAGSAQPPLMFERAGATSSLAYEARLLLKSRQGEGRREY